MTTESVTSFLVHMYCARHSARNKCCKEANSIFLVARRVECFITINNTVEGLLSQNDIDKDIKNAVIEDNTPLDCIWMIEVESNWQVNECPPMRIE